ncbi:MAG TPA: ATP-binding cassette domain-containing protein, partial [Myxococcaceae bacterium]
MTPAIELEQVSVTLGTRRVLENVSLRILPGELVALLGPSGSGKTSLLRVVLGFLAPETGVVRIDGEPVSANGRILRPSEERGVAMVFQDLALWPHLSVAGNLDFGLAARGVPRPARIERVGAMLSLVGLAERA